MAGRIALLGVVCCFALSCAPPPRWRADDKPNERDTALLFTEQGVSGTFREMYASEIPQVPVRSHLRPCCAFGAQLRAKLGPVPIPGYCWPDGTWGDCCVEHDITYWCGGSRSDRREADRLLRACAARSVTGWRGATLGALLEAGVFVGGAPWLPSPWRWGYGHPFPSR